MAAGHGGDVSSMSHRGSYSSSYSSSGDNVIPIPAESIAVLVAIDLGESGVGYCITFRPREGTLEPESLTINPYAPGEGGAASLRKTLTAVLLTADTQEIVAVGRAARERFDMLSESEDGKEKKFLYFEHFKMALTAANRRGQNPTDVTITGLGAGVEVPLLLPFSKLLQFIKKEALDAICTQVGNMADSDMGWVLTVPASWNEETKAFMRKAAVSAGLIENEESRRLLLIPEPECAANAALMSAPEAAKPSFALGRKLMVIDAGYKAVEVTLSHVISTKPLRLGQLLPPSGGPWGTAALGAKFLSLVMQLLGERTAALLPAAGTARLLEFWKEALMSFQSGNTVPPTYRLHIGEVLDYLPQNEDGGAAIRAGIAAFNSGRSDTEHLALTRQRQFILPAGLVHDLIFKPVVDSIIAHVQGLLADPKAKGTNLIVVAGGFAEAPYFQQSVKAAFQSGDRAVVIPSNAAFAVTQGAALFGLYPYPSRATEGLAKHTYGILFAPTFDPSQHNPITKATFGHKSYSDNALRVLIRKGEAVDLLNPNKRISGFRPSSDSTSITFTFWRTEEDVPSSPTQYLLKPGWKEAGVPGIAESCVLGKLVVQCFDPEKHWEVKREDRAVDLEFCLAEHNVSIKASAKLTGDVQSVFG